jgi:hypothetical protein
LYDVNWKSKSGFGFWRGDKGLCLNWKVKVVLSASGEAARVFSISMPFTKQEKREKETVDIRSSSNDFARRIFLVDSGL